jgi:hypothetical protein
VARFEAALIRDQGLTQQVAGRFEFAQVLEHHGQVGLVSSDIWITHWRCLFGIRQSLLVPFPRQGVAALDLVESGDTIGE